MISPDLQQRRFRAAMSTARTSPVPAGSQLQGSRVPRVPTMALRFGAPAKLRG